MNKLEDTLEKFMKATIVNKENNMAAIRNIKTQVGQISKQLVEGQSGQFSANTQTNLKEHCNTIVIESGTIAGERDGDNVVVEKGRKNEIEGERNEKERGKNMIEEKKIEKKSENDERDVIVKELSYSHVP